MRRIIRIVNLSVQNMEMEKRGDTFFQRPLAGLEIMPTTISIVPTGALSFMKM